MKGGRGMDVEREVKMLLKDLSETPGVKGVILATREGFSRVIIGEMEEGAAPLIASLTSISSQVLQGLAKKELDYVITRSGENFVVSVPVKPRMNLAVLLERDLVELEGIDKVVSRVKAAAIQIAAVDEAKSYAEKGIIPVVKKVMPEAIMVAVLTAEGMPLDAYPSLDYVTTSGMLSAVITVCDRISRDGSEYSVIGGEEFLVVLHKLPRERILAIAVDKKGSISEYLLKVREVVAKVKGET